MLLASFQPTNNVHDMDCRNTEGEGQNITYLPRMQNAASTSLSLHSLPPAHPSTQPYHFDCMQSTGQYLSGALPDDSGRGQPRLAQR